MKNGKQVIHPLPLSLAHERPFAGAYRVFCPWRGNVAFTKGTPGRGTLPVLYYFVRTPWPVPSFLPEAHARGSSPVKVVHFQTSRAWAPLTICKKTYTTQFPQLPSLWSKRFSCVNPTLHSFNPSLPHFLFYTWRKCSLPSVARQLFSPSIYFRAHCTCHTISLQLLKSFFQFSDPFTGCSKWSDFNTAVP